MSEILQICITIACAFVASSGFWAYIQNRDQKKDLKGQMLIGLAHDRIIFLGMQYVKRGYITQDEYENLHDNLYIPYVNLGGNGSAKRVMAEVDKLEIK